MKQGNRKLDSLPFSSPNSLTSEQRTAETEILPGSIHGRTHKKCWFVAHPEFALAQLPFVMLLCRPGHSFIYPFFLVGLALSRHSRLSGNVPRFPNASTDAAWCQSNYWRGKPSRLWREQLSMTETCVWLLSRHPLRLGGHFFSPKLAMGRIHAETRISPVNLG